MEKMKWIFNENARKDIKKTSLDDFSEKKILKAKKFHESFLVYEKTPLVRLNSLSNALNIKGIFVKDESYRFGLNAFKVLGGSYAIGNFLAEKLGKDIDDISFDYLKNKEVKEKLGNMVFTTATDGNHGRGVAWAATQLGQNSVVYMPKGSSKIRLDNIIADGAKASITDLNYDDAVRLSLKHANENGWEIIQDTAWEGYTKVPLWIMQGYGTMMLEIIEQLKDLKGKKMTHLFLQAGVGAMAGAIQAVVASIFKEDRPITVIVEPNKADCIYKSALNKKITNVTGDMQTIMAGLACGEPNPIGWDILKDYSDAYVSCPEYISAKGMRVLGNPMGEDKKVISGESGAVTLGLLYEILTNEDLKELKEELKLDENSLAVVISTEGDTDPEHYRKIVWDGAYNK